MGLQLTYVYFMLRVLYFYLGRWWQLRRISNISGSVVPCGTKSEQEKEKEVEHLNAAYEGLRTALVKYEYTSNRWQPSVSYGLGRFFGLFTSFRRSPCHRALVDTIFQLLRFVTAMPDGDWFADLMCKNLSYGITTELRHSQTSSCEPLQGLCSISVIFFPELALNVVRSAKVQLRSSMPEK